MKISAILIILLIAFVGPAKADPVSYTFSAIGSGSLGSDSFSDQTFTITSTADTADITESTGPGVVVIYVVPDTATTVTVDGLGTATFTIPTENVANSIGAVAIEAPGQTTDNSYANVLDQGNFELSDYNLSTSIGPISGNAGINDGLDFSTTAGDFDLTSVTTDTFQAQVVPEPGSCALLTLGTVVLCSRRIALKQSELFRKRC